MNEIIGLINQMSPFILLGFLLAGLMHAFVPRSLYSRHLGGNSMRAVFNAAMIGIPLPLCSCGVIPTAMSLRREGASKASTVSFLISTPQTGADSIIATYSLMGLPFALLRPVIALLTSLFGGFLVGRFGGAESTAAQMPNTTVDQSKEQSLAGKVREALQYAFVDMMQDIGKWLILGLIVAGVITICVPDSIFALFADNSLLSMLIVMVFAIPMYLCATGSIPIAVALMMKGLSPGAALVLLMAGPAVNTASVLVISKVLGRRTMILYLAAVVLGAFGFGLCIDNLMPAEWFTNTLISEGCCHEDVGVFHMVCSAVLGLLLANAFYQKYRKKTRSCSCNNQNNEANECITSSNNSTKTNTMTEITIKGMNCNHCKANAEKAIKSVDGVTGVEVDLASGKATINGTFSINDVCKAIEEVGFSVEL